MAVAFRVSGSKIKAARLRAGMTQSQLARAAQTSERNIVRWENDQNSPRAGHVAAIAKATGVDQGDLMQSLDESGEDEEDADRVFHADLLEALWSRIGQALGKEEAAA